MNKDLISNDIQLDSSGKLIHLLGLEGLSKNHLTHILDVADGLLDVQGNLKKSKALDDMSIANLFFEPSTRTRNTFEIAGKRTSANIINVDLANSATKKNESLLDTMHTLKAMQIDMFVIRHKQSGLPHHVAENIDGVSILNAGDGINAHPTQALLDMLTIRQHKQSFEDLSIAIVGDITHSRVAHSDIQALKTLGASDIRLIAPAGLQYDSKQCATVKCFDNIEEGIKNCDVVMVLRLQKERMLEADIPNEQEYFDNYGLTPERLALAKSDAIVMHPGPINRGVEIDSSVANGKQSVILQQVSNGIAVRMAVMEILAGNS
ncbi:Aspartate carbamoyltransferase (EC 2.1.3.2) [uncultured Gammaproteobacteria bacterium]|jgi:aspartate carbamoyltransferase catalytic subunit|uniref:aspartate carbamoyltransferase catalytic subunit n=1 Tax=thiotrophic endosymbiont of Bathymodiolus puteoserpentis (Logatchev) TaxID=343240 RepID=UPI0010B7334E|nr:aspartate carbamoyltransferase catalytic subunit [thiotrophic endosymbiont of Bathymodiolus puteoserpentis (Logatchev)]CAC9581828.1 Aspartate carbamoyltransferase (EC 2.1.3.2) [uncultured Gammaproteobacteria bacterium]CAC9583505.1 Aspartate carbamoyltransferase (EC 2.1.3.2) [uncultured Gammaproteobacteria bacterium]CAC9587984.1 Aspartate carbamoyltransferase (EC 2.1.3.2) [uncultured Gammaproteobacteria bacterium]CAC9636031.1 Aspartate carbamoyltransferase (EC 2.1.3.2) [uncultured Gammaproteo